MQIKELILIVVLKGVVLKTTYEPQMRSPSSALSAAEYVFSSAAKLSLEEFPLKSYLQREGRLTVL